MIWALILAAVGCSTGCPLPVDVDFEESAEPYFVEIEVESVETGELVHTARGQLVWGEKKHLGGTEHRGLLWDRPDYEVNARMISPEKVWTST